MKNVKIISSERFDHNGKPHWRIQITAEMNGKQLNFSHCFPEEIFIFRSAEYGFDPTDVDTILDVVLTEVHAEPEPGTHLYDLNDRDEARKHHTARCARQKLSMRLSTRSNKSVLKVKAADPNDPTTHDDVEADHPLDAIRKHLTENPVDHRDVAHLRGLVDRTFVLGRQRRGN